jgi:serine/threonine protein kinase
MNEILIGQTLAGKYRLDEILRENAFGKTFRATHVLMEKTVAVKVLNPAFAAEASLVADFQTEAKLLSKLNHPHVLNVTDYGADEERGLPFLVMENFDARTLRDLIGAEGALPLPRASAIVQQIADALGAAHDVGLIHGAMRSDAVLLVGAGNSSRDFVKVVDFDAANKTSAINANAQSNVAAAYAAAYLAPEQCDGSLIEAEARSDVYALGVVLYEMLAGRLPFVGATADEVKLKHAQEIPPSLLASRPDLPPFLEQIVQRALAKNPGQRFQTAAEFSDALSRAAEQATPAYAFRDEDTVVHQRATDASAAATAAPTNANSASDARWRTAFIVLAGISLLSAGLFFFTQNRRTTPGTELSTDPNASSVLPINPTNGNIEQGLNDFNLNLNLNSNLDANLAPLTPGGTATDIPLGGRIPPGLYPGGQQVYIDPNTNSPFMPGNPDATIQPPPNANRNVNANVNPANRNANTAAPTNANANPTNAQQQRPPAGNANAAPTPAATAPATTPATKPPPPASKPTPRATTPAVPKPTQPPTEKSSQNLSERISG